MYVGVDGCRAGWLAVTDAGAGLEYKVFATMRELLGHYSKAVLVLVDIPIGSPWRDCPRRPCDVLARKKLGPGRASSVFPAPCRAATRARDVAQARIANIAELGCSISEQAWGICKKIAEADELLAVDVHARTVLREVHPELCFWSLNGDVPTEHSKKSKGGSQERLALLTKAESASPFLLTRVLAEQRRKDVQADDVLDALVAFVTAREGVAKLRREHGIPPNDALGLPMEMLYL